MELIPNDDDQKQLEIDRRLHGMESRKISRGYIPSVPNNSDPYGGQLFFHQSKHPVRFLCPGNGWGKTVAMGHEANAWLTHTNMWQRTPLGPIRVIWYGPGESQWHEIRKTHLERFCLDQPWIYLKGSNSYEFRDGGRLAWRSFDAGWIRAQGTEPHLVLMDELAPHDLFLEMEMRGRGETDTRIVIASTQTQGTSWMEEILYRRWLDFHKGLGMGEEEAMREQQHDYIWCWPKGGIRSNPAMKEKDFKKYEETIIYSSEAEKQVRLRGGFGDWSGTSVFDLAGVRWLQERSKLVIPWSKNASFVDRDAMGEAAA